MFHEMLPWPEKVILHPLPRSTGLTSIVVFFRRLQVCQSAD